MRAARPPTIVDTDGHIFLNDRAVSLAQLRDELDRLKKAGPEKGVVVRGSGAADYQHAVSVLDILQQLDIAKVGLATRQWNSPRCSSSIRVFRRR